MNTRIASLALVSVAFLFMGQGCISRSQNENTTLGPAGIFVSTDKAETWQPISRLVNAVGVLDVSSASVYRIFEDPQDPRAMYWATRGQGLLYTYDNGNSWQRPEGALGTGFIYSVAVHPKDKCTLYVTNGGFVYKSTDCSRSWVEVYRDDTGSRIGSLSINPFAPHQLYLAKSNGDILESQDQGISWKVIYFLGKRVIDLFSDPYTEGRIYLATETDGIYRSLDGGKQWQALDTQLKGFPGGLEYRRFMLSPQEKDLLYYISTYGIHISKDGGDNWQTLNLIHPPGSARIFGFAVDPTNPKEMYYTATINERSTLYKTVDGGDSWITKRLPSGQIPTVLRSHPTEIGWLYLGFTIPVIE